MSVPSFSGSGGVGVGSWPPILGETEPSMNALRTGSLTTGDLVAGDAGNASGFAGMTFECWFAFSAPNAIPTSTWIVASGPEVSAGVRQYQFSITTTGAISVTVRHATSGAITATSPAAYASVAPVWTHIVGAVLGATLTLYVNGASANATAWPAGNVATASYAAGVSDLVLGWSTNPLNYNWNMGDVAFYFYGLSAARVLAHYQAGAQRGFDTHASGTRVGAVLDTMASTAPRRIDAGVRSVTPRYMAGQTPITAIREAVSAEAVDSGFFVAADGTLIFLDSDHRSSSPYNTSQATFGDGAGELPYVGVNVVYDEASLANEWNGTIEGTTATPGVTQTVSDSTSISRYFKRSQSLTSIPVPADADALNIVTAYLAKYKDPLYRITQLTFTTLDAGVTEAIFRREIGDKITVLRTPPGGGSRISQVLWIQKIDVAGANDGGPWTVTWGVSPV